MIYIYIYIYIYIIFTKQKKQLNSVSITDMEFFNVLIVMKLNHFILKWLEFSKLLNLINLICGDYSCSVLIISKLNYLIQFNFYMFMISQIVVIVIFVI